MKTRILQILGVVAIATIGMTSCDTDACKDVECGEYGTCLDGDCVCDAGFSGTNCDVMWSASFLGTFDGDDDCDFLYQSVITSPTPTTLSISNAFGTAAAGTATITSATTITFANQDLNGFVINGGTGTLAGSVLTIDYTIDGTACTVTYTK